MKTKQSQATVGAELALSGEARQTLEALADALIPSDGSMPSATEAGAASEWLNQVLSSRPDLAPSLAAVLERMRGRDPAAGLVELRAQDPVGLEVLTTVIAGAYFLNPGIRQRIGYPGQEALAIPAQDPPDFDQDGLLAAVVERGPIYRPTPPG